MPAHLRLGDGVFCAPNDVDGWTDQGPVVLDWPHFQPPLIVHLREKNPSPPGTRGPTCVPCVEACYASYSAANAVEEHSDGDHGEADEDEDLEGGGVHGQDLPESGRLATQRAILRSEQTWGITRPPVHEP